MQKATAEQACADVAVACVGTTEACIEEVNAQVSALEDAWGRVDRLTQGMPTQGFMDDLEEVWLEIVMACERDY